MSAGVAERSAEGAPPVPLRETCRLVLGTVPLWPYHRRRLSAGGCGEALLDEVDVAVVRESTGWTGASSSRLRLTVVVTPDGRVDARVQRRLSSLDVPGGPVAVPVEVREPPKLPGGAAKPADRSWWDDAQRRARARHGDQAILVTPDGRVLDGGTSSVWAVLGGALVTPPAPGAIAGVARAFVLDECRRAGMSVRIAAFDAGELDDAGELFLTNAFAGPVAVRGRGGPVCDRVKRMFASAWTA